jgi:hypothetical protein
MGNHNLRNVRREANRHFRNKKREYLKDKITGIELNSKNKNIRDLYRGITEFKKGYQPKTNVVRVKQNGFRLLLFQQKKTREVRHSVNNAVGQVADILNFCELKISNTTIG